MSYTPPSTRQPASSQHRQTRPATPAEMDDLHERVNALPPSQFFEHFERFIGTPQLLAAGLTIGERRTYPPRFPQRDREICRRNDRGESYGMLALDYGLSRSRIAQICQQGRAKSVQGLAGYTVQAG